MAMEPLMNAEQSQQMSWSLLGVDKSNMSLRFQVNYPHLREFTLLVDNSVEMIQFKGEHTNMQCRIIKK